MTDLVNYTLKLRIIHVQKQAYSSSRRSTSEKQSAADFNLAYPTGMHLLARFSKVVLGLALLSWRVIGYSL
jgi:hypothetical protein